MRVELKWLGSCGVLAIALYGIASAQDEALQRNAQAILAESCYACHGPGQQMAKLRLDTDAAKVVVSGNSSNSALIQRVTGAGGKPRMPLGAAPLSDEKIAVLAKWIDAGARLPAPRKHWAFVPPVRPLLPRTSDSRAGRNPIDAFITARLERESLKASPEADRATLLRRVSLDLIGLPPTPAELDAFLADKAPDAYSKQVDRLLASPRYGERWARVWLDGARYADSNGYEKDAPRFVWFYRDWVINALNRDMPYNQFVIEQIAGDLLPNAGQDQRVATGFLRNSMVNEEGGVDPEQFRMEGLFDRMDAIGKGVLGVTIQCAQCHTHKYDPLTHEEYYRIFAFLNNAHESDIAVYTPAEQKKRDEIARRTQEVEDDLRRRVPDWHRRMNAWEDALPAEPAWEILKLEVDDISTGGEREIPMKDGSMLALGYAPTKHTVKFSSTTKLPRVTAVRLELLNDPNLPNGGPGRSIKGTGALTEFRVEAAAPDAPERFQRLKILSATADVNPPEAPLDKVFDDRSGRKRVTGPIPFAIDEKDETAWGIDAGPGRRNQPRKAVFVLDQAVERPSGARLNLYLKQDHGGSNSDDNENNNLGRIRLSVTGAPNPQADPLPQDVRAILATPRDKRTAAQVRLVFSYWRTTVPEWRAENDRIERLWSEYPEGSRQLTLAERTDDPRQTHILKRGDFLQPDRPVTPGTPAFLNAMPAGPPNRLTFARWLVDRGSPTTARSIVNRVWQAYFGTGIVASVENLGTQAEAPSHPELLDWLAVEFMESGWSLKKLQRLIATSATYRQSSHIAPELLSKDPDNRLLARGPRFRVDAEIVRDIALAVSGLLNDTIGGPSVYPPAPAFLFQPPASYGPKMWGASDGPDRYRRALYTFRFRSVPYPALQAFDAPNGDMSCVRRARSNTPLQALTTLNEPLFVEAAQALARRTLTEGGSTDRDRLSYAFRLTTARVPTNAEADVLLQLLAKQDRRLADGWLSAGELAGIKPGSTLPPDTTPRRLAAWTAVARVLLNLDETISKE